MIELRQILNGEKGLSVRAKLNTLFQDIILGKEGINSIQNTLRSFANEIKSLSRITEDKYEELRDQILKSSDYTDKSVADLLVYINGMNGGVSGFAENTSFNPDFPLEKSVTVLAGQKGTYTHLLDQNGAPITITQEGVTIFYRGANSTYWKYKTIPVEVNVQNELLNAITSLESLGAIVWSDYIPVINNGKVFKGRVGALPKAFRENSMPGNVIEDGSITKDKLDEDTQGSITGVYCHAILPHDTVPISKGTYLQRNKEGNIVQVVECDPLNDPAIKRSYPVEGVEYNCKGCTYVFNGTYLLPLKNFNGKITLELTEEQDTVPSNYVVAAELYQKVSVPNGKKFMDSRQQIATFAGLKHTMEGFVPDGFRAYCKEDGRWYQYNLMNTEDPITGKWRLKDNYYTKEELNNGTSALTTKGITDDEFEVDEAANHVFIHVVTDKNELFSPNETVIMPDVPADGISGHEPLTLYITEANNEGFTAIVKGYDADIPALTCGSFGANKRVVRKGWKDILSTIASKQPAITASNDIAPLGNDKLALTTPAKYSAFDDVWVRLCSTYGGLDYSHTENNISKPYRLNGLWLTRNEAIDIVAQYRTWGAEHEDYSQSSIRTNIPIKQSSSREYSNSYSYIEVANLAHCYPKTMYTCFAGNRITSIINFNAIYLINCYTCFEAPNLVTLDISNLKISLNLSKCPLIDLTSWQGLVSRAANTSAITITVHPDVYAKLTGDTTNAAASALSADELAQWQALVAQAAEKQITFATT